MAVAFGLEGQPFVVPAVIGEMMSDPDPERPERVMQALIRMKKPDIEGLERGYDPPLADTSAHRKNPA